MKGMTRAGAALVAIAALFAITVGSASASGARSFHHPVPPRSNHPVFVQTDNLAGNQIVAYDQAANGSLTQAGTYNTGGLGECSKARSSTTSPRRAPSPGVSRRISPAVRTAPSTSPR